MALDDLPDDLLEYVLDRVVARDVEGRVPLRGVSKRVARIAKVPDVRTIMRMHVVLCTVHYLRVAVDEENAFCEELARRNGILSLLRPLCFRPAHLVGGLSFCFWPHHRPFFLSYKEGKCARYVTRAARARPWTTHVSS